MSWPDYQLLDFGVLRDGSGRKLEQFGNVVVDRPAPAATGKPADASEWQRADWRYTGAKIGEGRWRVNTGSPREALQLTCDVTEKSTFQLTVDRLPNGQVGLFPEQFPNWQWIALRCEMSPSPLKVINLFGYTGGSTLAAAAAGAEVTHVDASKPAVALARQNAEASGLAEHPIRWIVEDAVKYVAREVKRGQQYDAVILDPPSYGHGPGGESWKLIRDLPKLLALCKELTAGSPQFLLLTCHTPEVGMGELAAYFADGFFGHCGAPPQTTRLKLSTVDGRSLPSGIAARWPQ